jgi:hypothetical protein
MTINVYVVLCVSLALGIGLGALIAGGVAIRYILQLQERLVAANYQLGMALGKLNERDNQQIVHLKGKEQVLWGLLGSVEKHLFLEYRDGKLIRVIGETADLSIFPEITAEQVAAVACLIAKGVRVAGRVAAGCAGVPLAN